ncbi:LamG domain-containing protein [Galbibacter sp. EGI 63066]|uniref:LamG domain-containing protein n=1 Tax=Galbibacter sp. EGI 63066 TaxID=2993559 RepID=UPI002248C9C7|nr:LamG domain-containing protein [Galbibacter sp. EGI 63066]MCX2679301.1 LamG domain-containing protein [Galbibacter sp. EGI 63066]
MKTLYKLLMTMIIGGLVVSCYNGVVDSVSEVDPGPDQGPPVIEFQYPLEGTSIQVPEPTTSIVIKAHVEDDIEVGEVVLQMDGAEIAVLSDFVDYRNAYIELPFDGVTNGDHELTISATDLEGNNTVQSVNYSKLAPYEPLYEGEMLYMPFEGDYTNLITYNAATVEGSPGFAGEANVGVNAYAGATDSYLTFPSEALQNEEFSATFWYKLNNDPDRAGILVMGPEDPDNTDAANNRTKGFRFFREAAGDMQRFKLNVGTGDGESWFDGGEAADVDPAVDQWIHLAFTISNTECVVYINGNVVSQNTFSGIDWDGCDVLSIMSGAPRFIGWNHLSDQSYMDDLRIFDVALTQEDIQSML